MMIREQNYGIQQSIYGQMDERENRTTSNMVLSKVCSIIEPMYYVRICIMK